MIYKIDIWHKINASGKKVQTLYCLSDMHGVESIRPQDKEIINGIDQAHRRAIVGCVEQLKQSNALFIVEDPFSIKVDSHKKIISYLSLYRPLAFMQQNGDKPSLLLFLADILKEEGCDVVNIEYRQGRVISHFFNSVLGELRQTGSYQLSQFNKNINSLYGATLEEVVQEFKDALARVKAYGLSDGALLGNYYAQLVAKLEKTLPFADLLIARKQFYWDLVDLVAYSARGMLHDSFLLWGLELVDAYALHALYNASDRNTVCMVTGGVHAHAIGLQLPLLGYKHVQTIGKDSLTVQEYNDRALLVDKLFNVEQLLPVKSDSWFDNWWTNNIACMFVQHSIRERVVHDPDAVSAFNRLNIKLACAMRLEESQFHVLREKHIPLRRSRKKKTKELSR